MAVLANDTAKTPRCDQQRAGVAQRLAFSPCTLRAPGQTGWGECQCPAARDPLSQLLHRSMCLVPRPWLLDPEGNRLPLLVVP